MLESLASIRPHCPSSKSASGFLGHSSRTLFGKVSNMWWDMIIGILLLLGNCLLCRMFLGRTAENQFTEISRLVSLFPSGVEPRPPSRDFGRGNAQRASANDPPIAQRIAVLRVARVVDNQFQKARKRGRQFG